jgi:hypothetical protein
MIRAAWELVRNPPLEFVDDDDIVVDSWQASRRERWELMKPHWWYTTFARELSCGCTRRWWGTVTLYDASCQKHMGSS